MKKLLSILAIALCFAACQNDGVREISNGDLVDVVLSVDAPELSVTRADEDTKADKNSAYGAIDFFNDADWAKFDIRYILEVYDAEDDGDGEPIYRERLVNCLDKYAPTTFALRLVPERNYKFVVFADFAAEGNAELTEPADKLAIADLYYNTADLRNITAKTDVQGWNAMNEARDAYFVSQNVFVTDVTKTFNETLTLTRPFGKVRVITTDLDYIKGYSEPGYVEVKYQTETIYKSFNAVNGLLNAAEMTGDELEYEYAVDKSAPYTAGYDSITTNQTLFTDYVFAKEGEQIPVNFTMTVYEDAAKTKKIHEQDFNTQIPVQRNHLTTIVGDMLTTQANIQIKINDDFVDEFVRGANDGHDNSTIIEEWGSGETTAAGDYKFTLKAEGSEFVVTINGDAVVGGALEEGEYVLASQAEEGYTKTFTVENLKANATTRALTNVAVIGGTMDVIKKENGKYDIAMNLVLDYGDNNVRHALYKRNDVEILFGARLDTPVVTATVDGNKVTLSWAKVNDATSYFVRLVAEDNDFEETTELTKVYTDLAWETTYQFEVYAQNASNRSVTRLVEAEVGEEPAAVLDQLVMSNVTSKVEGLKITLSWEAVEGASKYVVNCKEVEDTEDVDGTEYEFNATEYDTEYTFTVKAIAADTTKNTDSEEVPVTVTIGNAPAVETPAEGTLLTIEDFLKYKDTEVAYQITGVISNVANRTKGNFDLTDATGTIYVYGVLNSTGGKDGAMDEYGLRVGDTVTLQGKYMDYNDKDEIVSTTLINHIAIPFIEAEGTTVDADDTTASLTVTSNVAWTVTSCDATWVTSYTQSNDGTIEVVMEANESEESREATFTLTADGVEDVTVTLKQKGKVVAGNVDEFVITFPGSPSKFTGAYTSSFDITKQDNYKFTFTNINNGQKSDNWAQIRMGRKSDPTIATIVTDFAVPYAVQSVEVSFTQIKANNPNLNSAKLIVATDSQFENVVDTVEVAPAVGVVKYNVTKPAANYYYKLEYDIKADGANGNYRIDKITYVK